MGAIVLPTVPGDDCVHCYGPGETPNKLHCFLGDVSMGTNWHGGLPVPPNDFYVLHQDSVLPCLFRHLGPLYDISVWFRAGSTIFDAVAIAGANIFRNAPLVACEHYFTNDFTEPPARFYFGGFAYITTMEELAAEVNQVVPVRPESARFEVHPGPGRIIDVRLADSHLRQNILVQLDKS